ncbi:MAG: chemotaxis protein CheX [Proteobacteria bacterium]|nr:chemotaxis protein CheX [Pseudomonadota bacterium]
MKIFAVFVQEAIAQTLPSANLKLIEAPEQGDLVNWPEPIQVSIMGFQSDKIKGTAVIGCDHCFFDQFCPGLDKQDPQYLALAQDWLGEFSNLLLGRLKNRLLPYEIILRVSPPSVSEASESIYSSYTRCKENLKLWFNAGQAFICVAFSMDIEAGVDLGARLPAQGHSLQPGDAIYRLNGESHSSNKYDVISQIRSGVMTEDDSVLHDDFDFDLDLEHLESRPIVANNLVGVEELEKPAKPQQENNIQMPVSVGRGQSNAYPEIQFSGSKNSSRLGSKNRRNLEGMEWNEAGELHLCFQGGNLVSITPLILLEQGTNTLMIEGYKVDIQQDQKGLRVTIPELQITLEAVIRAA